MRRNLLLFKKALCIVLPIAIIFSVLSAALIFSSADEHRCGDGLTWRIEVDVLIIEKTGEGTGEMDDYTHGGPWTNEAYSSIKIENGVTSIGENAFYFSNVQTVVIEDGLKRIGDGAFYGCHNLSYTPDITIPDSVEYIGSGVFSGCQLLENDDNYDDGILYLGKHLIKAKGLKGALDLSNFSIDKDILMENLSSAICRVKEGTKTIAGYAFSINQGVRYVTLPNSVVSIGPGAFSNCYSLKEIKLSKNLKYIGSSAFYECDDLKSITLPDGITEIEDRTFYGCKKLSSVTIPKKVITIGAYAFADCSELENVTIKNSNIEIDDTAFDGCSVNLTIYAKGDNVAEWADRHGFKYEEYNVVSSNTKIAADNISAFFENLYKILYSMLNRNLDNNEDTPKIVTIVSLMERLIGGGSGLLFRKLINIMI